MPTTTDHISPADSLAEPPGPANPAPAEAGALPDPEDVARSVLGTPGDRPPPASPADLRPWLAEAADRDFDIAGRGRLDGPGDLVGPLAPVSGARPTT